MTPAIATLTAKGAATRARLLSAAAAELRATGAVEVARVARRAGVAQSVLYRYFDGKDGLIAAVVHDFYDQYDAEVFRAPVDVDGGWFAREEERLRREVRFLYEHPLGRVIAAGLAHEAAATRADAERLREQVRGATRNIRRGQRAGEIDPSVDAGLAGAATIGALRSMLADALSRRRPPAQAEVLANALRVGSAALSPSSSSPR